MNDAFLRQSQMEVLPGSKRTLRPCQMCGQAIISRGGKKRCAPCSANVAKERERVRKRKKPIEVCDYRGSD
jgi:hypothetical protein